MNNDELKKLAFKVLEDGYIMNLGIVDENGVWVSPVIYINDGNFNLYWVSIPGSRHSQAIEKNNKVACSVIASWETKKERALQIEGVAERVDKMPLGFEQKLEKKRGLDVPLVVGETLKGGQIWYVLRPIKIELIHSEPFGYERKSINLL
jgi:hypothetical protein